MQVTEWLTQRTSERQNDAPEESQTERLTQRTNERQNGKINGSLVGWPSEGLRVRQNGRLRIRLTEKRTGLRGELDR